MEIIKVYKQKFPEMKLVGKKYGPKSNGYSSEWGQWFQNNWFGPLESLVADLGMEDAFIGLIRCRPEFEYWIGVFAKADAEVPEGYESVMLPEGEAAIAWIYGSDENGEIYGAEAHAACTQKFTEQGWQTGKANWFFERYVCPRFTNPDKLGNVILDHGVFLE